MIVSMKLLPETQVIARTSGWVRSAHPMGEVRGADRAASGPVEGAENAIPHLLRDLLARDPGAGAGAAEALQ